MPRDWRIVVADSGIRAEKSGRVREAYNDRRRACEEALAVVSEALVGRGMLRSASNGYPDLLRSAGSEAALVVAEAELDDRLFRRFRHVVTEAGRVERAEIALAEGDAAEFGALMDASHRSLRDDYEVSAPELDSLVHCAKEGGAAGARLTGAGFGGCIVALAHSGSAAEVLASIRSGYYGARGGGASSEAAFVAIPSTGASMGPLPAEYLPA
jgi:galactokinase